MCNCLLWKKYLLDVVYVRATKMVFDYFYRTGIRERMRCSVKNGKDKILLLLVVFEAGNPEPVST